MHPDLRERLQHDLGDAYRLERELGGGSSARVFLAEDVELGRPVVVKVLAPDLGASVDVERFRREIRIAGSLTHPNIVPVLASGCRDGVIFFTMPYVEGESLHEALRRTGPLGVDHALRIAADVAEALVAAHRHDVVHRDIKPDNILLVGDGTGGWRAQVADFGIARAIERSAALTDSVTSTGLTLGTPLYMSPEQAAADRRLDGRSDIYALGCVLFEMLAGEPPFTGADARIIIARHMNEPPRSLRLVRPDIPAWVEQLVRVMLAKAPADRFPDAESLLRALRHSSGTVSAQYATPRGAGAGRRRRVVAGVLAVGALVSVGALLRPYLAGARAAASGTATDPTRIAVLYLEAPPGDQALAHLGRGITRDLIDALGEVPSLTVTSDLGVRAVAGDGVDLAAIVRRLDVGTIVHGSLEANGDSLHVLIRLSDARGVQRASVPLAVARAEIPGLRQLVAGRVAEALRREVGIQVARREWRAATRDDSAWVLRQRAADLLSSGREVLLRGAQPAGLALLDQADAMFAVAAARDRRWSDPVVQRGWIAAHRALGADAAARERWLTASVAFADEALGRNAGDARALELRGVQRYRLWRHVYGGRDSALIGRAMDDLRAATAADSRRARAWTAIGEILNDRGDAEGAASAARSAIAADPYLVDVAPSIQLLVFAHLQAERYDSARALCVDGARRFPAAPELQSCELSVLGWSGRGARDSRRVWELLAREERSAGEGGSGVWPPGRAFAAAVLARSGMTDSARAVLDATRARLGARASGPEWLVYEAFVQATIGDHGEALTLLERATALDGGMGSAVAALPWFRPLRSDARFRKLTAPSR